MKKLFIHSWKPLPEAIRKIALFDTILFGLKQSTSLIKSCFRLVVELLSVNKPSSDCIKVWKIFMPNQNLNYTRKGKRKVGQKRFLKKKKSHPSLPFKNSNFFHQIYLENCQTSLSYWKSHSKQLWFPWLNL